MININVKIANSIVSEIDNRNCGAAGSYNNVEMIFTFSEEWEGFDKKVVFVNSKQEAPTYKLIENDTALVTANALKYDGIIYFSVTGTKVIDGELVEKTLSVAEYLTVEKSVDGGTIDPPLDPDLLAQMQSIINDFIAQVNAGDFNGKSAYDFAVEAGYTGTIEEFSNELNAIKLKANSADVYPKTQTYTREEILQKIADLINSAPSTLDTLNELALALGNDPSFATKIINLIGTEASNRAQGDTNTLNSAKSYADGILNDFDVANDNALELKADKVTTYTKTEVATLISNLVNGAPELLDTLYEVANAIGNDENFASTIMTLIGTKANQSSTYTKVEVDSLNALKVAKETGKSLVSDTTILKMESSNVVGIPIVVTSTYITGVNYDSASQTFTKVNHGLTLNLPVELSFDVGGGGGLPSGYTVYDAPIVPIIHGKCLGWIFNVTPDTFQISASYNTVVAVTTITNGSGLKIRPAGQSSIQIAGLNGNADGGKYTLECLANTARTTAVATSNAPRIFINDIKNATYTMTSQAGTLSTNNPLTGFILTSTTTAENFQELNLELEITQMNTTQIKLSSCYQMAGTASPSSNIWSPMAATASGIKRGRVWDAVNASNITMIEFWLGGYYLLNDSVITIRKVK